MECQQPWFFTSHSSSFSSIQLLITFNFVFSSHILILSIRLSHLHVLHSLLTIMNYQFYLASTTSYTHLSVQIHFKSRLPIEKIFGLQNLKETNLDRCCLLLWNMDLTLALGSGFVSWIWLLDLVLSYGSSFGFGSLFPTMHKSSH